jgi:hypothetical protein
MRRWILEMTQAGIGQTGKAVNVVASIRAINGCAAPCRANADVVAACDGLEAVAASTSCHHRPRSAA